MTRAVPVLLLALLPCLAGIAHADDPVTMAHAMRHALEAGRMSYQAGRIPKKRYATASSPWDGVISYIPGE